MKQKTYTIKQTFDKLKKAINKKKKSPSVVNAHLKKHLKNIINTELKKDCRAEAMKILMKANRGEVAEFLITYYSDGNSVGLIGSALDFIKDRLVKDGEVDKNFGKSFGNSSDLF